MEKYELLTQIGDGTFGSVAKAVTKKTGQLVAIKKMKQKFYTWEECVKLPEVDVVRRIHGHPNIVKLREVIRENNELFFVFEYMDGDLLGVIKKSKLDTHAGSGQSAPHISYANARSYMRQLLQALAYIHKRGYFHRDLKPENLLVRKEPTGDEVVKLADFGLVKEIRSRPPFTDYVSTRWYRAPELLLQDRFYSCPVDIWAAGCIMAELITTRPLFPGTNEVDQLFKIMSILGSPTEKVWAGGMQLAKKIRYTFPAIAGTGLAQALPSHAPASAVDLVSKMLTYDPKQRLTAEQCLQHPFFTTVGDTNGESSLTNADQLGFAAKRVLPGPQSAPPPLRGSLLEPQSTAQKGGRATADGSLPEGSPRNYYTLTGTKDVTPPLKQGHAGAAAASSPTVTPSLDALRKGSPDMDAVGLPQIPGTGLTAKRRSQDTVNAPGGAVGGVPSLAAKLAGLKNVRTGNGGKSLSYAVNGSKGVPTATAGSPLNSAFAHPSPRTIAAAHSGLGNGKPLKMNAALPMRRNSTREPETLSPAAAVALSSSKKEVNLDELMEEFASEMTHLGGRGDKSESGGGANRRSNTNNKEDFGLDSVHSQDPVVAVLKSNQYRKSSQTGNEPAALPSLKSTAQTRTSSLQGKSVKADVDATVKKDLPRIDHSPKGVSPALRGLLAKHKTTGFSFQ